MRTSKWLLALLLGGGLCVTSVQAAVVSTSADIKKISAPSSVVQGALQSDSYIYLFEEQQGVVLGSDLSVDWLPSDGDSLDTGKGGTIAAGTRVNSYFLHFDPLSDDAKAYGEVDFSDEILAVIFTTTNLNDSDSVLGNSGTTYGNSPDRGYEPNDEEYSNLPLPKSWWATNYSNAGFIDQARVITAAPVPVPAALWLFGSALLAMVGIGRRGGMTPAS